MENVAYVNLGNELFYINVENNILQNFSIENFDGKKYVYFKLNSYYHALPHIDDVNLAINTLISRLNKEISLLKSNIFNKKNEIVNIKKEMDDLDFNVNENQEIRWIGRDHLGNIHNLNVEHVDNSEENLTTTIRIYDEPYEVNLEDNGSYFIITGVFDEYVDMHSIREYRVFNSVNCMTRYELIERRKRLELDLKTFESQCNYLNSKIKSLNDMSYRIKNIEELINHMYNKY